jgi:hypothetical protein
MRIGAPRILQTDNGSEFINPEMISLLRDCLVEEYRHGAVYKPQSQGVVERANQVLRRLLDVMCKQDKYQTWTFEEILRQIQYWMNSFTHRATKQSAYLLVYGRVPQLLTASAEMTEALESESSPVESAQSDAAAAPVDDITPFEQQSTPMEVDHHTDRQQAAIVNHAIYQAQWACQVNRSVIDETFEVGQMVLMTVVSPRGHKALAKQLDKQRVLICQQLPYSKYTIYTPFGFLKDAVHGNYLTCPTADAIRPQQLQLDLTQIAELVQGYKATKRSNKSVSLTIVKYIEHILTYTYEPVSADLTIREPQPGETELRPVVRITQKRKSSQI